MSKYFGNIPLLEADSLTVCESGGEVSKAETESYNIRNPEVVPEDEPVTVTACVKNIKIELEKGVEKYCLEICCQKNRLETMNLYLPRRLIHQVVSGLFFTFHSVVKILSKSKNPYFIITPMTNISPVFGDTKEVNNHDDDNDTFTLVSVASNNVVDAVVSVERVTSLVVSVSCGGCGSPVVSSECSYVGCSVVRMLEYSVRATLLVTCADKLLTLVTTSEEDLMMILNCSSDQWDAVRTEVNNEGRITMK